MINANRITVMGGAAVAVVAYAYYRWRNGGDDPITKGLNTVTDALVSGARLNHTTLDASGVVRVNPDDLVSEALAVYGSDFSVGGWTAKEVYSLARMSRSEAGAKDGVENRKARMHIALNDYYSVSWAHSLDDLFTFSTVASEKGFFGDQRGRRYSTAQDPRAGDIRLALEVIDEDNRGYDPTGGATKFVDKASLAVQKGVTKTYDEIVADWGRDGLKPFNVPGLSDDFVVFRKA